MWKLTNSRTTNDSRGKKIKMGIKKKCLETKIETKHTKINGLQKSRAQREVYNVNAYTKKLKIKNLK